MSKELDKEYHGLAAFRAALDRQEGSFHRAATYIMNAPKKQVKETDNERIAKALDERNAKGQFVAKRAPDVGK